MSNNNIGWTTRTTRLKSWLFSLLPCYDYQGYQAIGRVQPVLSRYVLVDRLLRSGILLWRHEGFATEIMRWTKWVHESMKVLISKLAVTSNVRVSLFFCQENSVHWNHISHSLRSKRFRFSVSEQRKIEERDSRFWPREKWNESQKARKRLPRRLHFLWWATGTLPSDH